MNIISQSLIDKIKLTEAKLKAANSSSQNVAILLKITFINTAEVTSTKHRVYSSIIPQTAYNPPVDDVGNKSLVPRLSVVYALAISFVAKYCIQAIRH